ncbi:MAG: hypothetical protein QXK94_05770 [Candidatus Jordarchaeales archaeon]
MIRAVWIIDEKNSFFRSYEKSDVDYSLISGLLTAIKTFVKDMSGGNVSSIDLEDRTFVYKITGEKIFIIYSDEREELDKVFEKLEELCLSIGEKEELSRRIDKVIESYNRRKRLEKLDELLQKI